MILIRERPAYPHLSLTSGKEAPRSLRLNARAICLAAAAALGLATPGAAAAQSFGIQNPEDLLVDQTPQGLRSGPQAFYPRIDFDLARDTNIYDRETAKIADTFVSVRPSVSYRPDLSRHEVDVTASGEIRRYFEQSSENSEQFGLRARTRLDLAQRIVVRSTAEIARRVESRGEFGDNPLSDSPIEYTLTSGGLNVGRYGGVLELGAGAQISHRNYSDVSIGGVDTDLSFRDVTDKRAFVDGSIRLSPGIRAFGEASYETTSYDVNPVRDRDSDGYSLLAGARFDVSDLIEAEVAAGYVHRSYDDPTIRSFNGLDFRVLGRWSPTPRLQVAAVGRRSVERSPSVGIPAVVQSRFQLEARQSLGSRMIAALSADVARWDYQDSPVRETRYAIDGSLSVRLARMFSVTGGAGYRKQTETGGGRAYDGATIRIGLAVII
ncbi:outer membrane beta-barrel protein [Croceicoccus sediminis]|uniref:outer membrane beta-barrel protein n=1 Tax=Croceicoccus sediminis TaxID=2571150 RepID=UPI0014796179|nr:outer membrane beta-barrel protein [Croceicoccus sediminis]